MSLEDGQQTPELIAKGIVNQLIKRLGTSDIPLCFRTAKGSVYVADENLRTVRYRAMSKSFEPISRITVFLDNKYLDPALTDRSSEQYLPNSLLHENGFLVLDDPNNVYPKQRIDSWSDLPDPIDIDTLKKSLFFVVFDNIQKKVVKKAPVALIPSIGDHPIEFGDPQVHRLGHRNHFGDMIDGISVTNKMSEQEKRKAVEALALLSLKKK